jgi:myosin heavy subunit
MGMRSAMQQLLDQSDRKSALKQHQETVSEPKIEETATQSTEVVNEEVATVPDVEPEVDLEIEKKRTLVSLEDEVKKLREENAKRRLEAKALREQAEELFKDEKSEYEKKIKALEQQTNELAKLKKNSVEQTVSEEEKIRLKDLELSEMKKEFSKLSSKYDEIHSSYKSFLDQQEQEKQIRSQAWDNKIKDEISKIPEEKRKFAEALIKGYEDKQEALFALLEAKKENLFGNKKVEVVHAVPKTSIVEEQQTTATPLNHKLKIRRGLSKALQEARPGTRLV